MSGVLSLRSDPDLEDDFSEIKKHLEKRLDSVQTLMDLNRLIKSVNELTRDQNYGAEERGYLRRIRQRAYDRRRVLQDSAEIIPPQDLDKLALELPIGAEVTSNTNSGFIDGIWQGLAQIDGEAFIRSLPATLVKVTAVAAVSSLLWLQSVDLYQSSGFKKPELVAAGALLMVMGFAAYHTKVKSWLAIFLCVYISVYEVQFMISATFQDEKFQRLERVSTDSALSLLEEALNREHASYLDAKSRYQDPNSKVYKNSWYKQNHLDQSWAKVEEAQKRLLTKKTSLLRETENMPIVWLKICYRLGLVFLCMVLIHAIFPQRKGVS